MEPKLTEAFNKIRYQSEDDFADQVWNKIVARDHKAAMFKLYVFSFAGICSFLALIPASKLLLNDFSKSGFYEYFSLALSNSGSINSYWREFMFTILESLPLQSIVLSLSLIFFFFLSIKYIAKQFTRNRTMLGSSRVLSY